MHVGKKDIEAKSYLSNPKRFSDIFNFWIYQGESVIQPDDLSEMDTTEIALPYGNNAKKPIQKFRDLLKLYSAMQDNQAIYLVLGLEPEAKTNYSMAVRNMLYDAMNYAQQVKDIADSHRKDTDSKPTSDEFLSGLNKEDRLMPVITLVVNISGDAWDGATSLHDMLAIKDERILSFVPDYRLNLLSPDKIADGDFSKFHTDVGLAFQFIKHMNDNNMDWINENKNFEQVERDTADFIQAVTGTKMQFDKNDEVVNMCKAWENSMNQARKEEKESTIVENMRKMVKNSNMTLQQIMDVLEIPMKDREKYAALVQL